MKLRTIWQLINGARKKFSEDRGPRLSAALAFYAALALSPLLLAATAGAGLVFGREVARREIVQRLQATVGPEAATVIERLVVRSARPPHAIFAAVVSFAVLVYGGAGLFAELRSALNTIWRVPGRKQEFGFGSMVKTRLLASFLVCAVAFLLFLSLIVSAVLSAFDRTMMGWLPEMNVFAELANFVLTLGVLILLFAMIFKWLPETDLAWSDVWVGATITAMLFSIGKYLIGLYLGRAAVGSAYGAAGAFVVLLVWIYYSTQIVLFGAELTFIYARRFGHGLNREPASPTGPELRAAM